MKIALVTELFPPSVGGQEIRFKEFAEEFARLGHSVDVFTIDHTGKLPAEETVNRVRILRTYRDANYYKKGILGRPYVPSSGSPGRCAGGSKDMTA